MAVGPETRYVRTPEGSEHYGLPIGSPITLDVIKKKNREAAALGIVPPKGAIEDSKGRVDANADRLGVSDLRPAKENLSGPLTFKVGEREYSAPEGSRLFKPRDKETARYVLTEDGGIYGFSVQSQIDVPENLQQQLSDRLTDLDENDERYEEVPFDNAPDGEEQEDGTPGSPEASGGVAGEQDESWKNTYSGQQIVALQEQMAADPEDTPAKRQAQRLLDEAIPHIPAVQAAVAEVDKYRTVDGFNVWRREVDNSTPGDPGEQRDASSRYEQFLADLRDRHKKAAAKVTQPVVKAMRLLAGLDEPDEPTDSEGSSQQSPLPGEGLTLDELRARRDSTLAAASDDPAEVPDDTLFAQEEADAVGRWVRSDVTQVSYPNRKFNNETWGYDYGDKKVETVKGFIWSEDPRWAIVRSDKGAGYNLIHAPSGLAVVHNKSREDAARYAAGLTGLEPQAVDEWTPDDYHVGPPEADQVRRIGAAMKAIQAGEPIPEATPEESVPDAYDDDRDWATLEVGDTPNAEFVRRSQPGTKIGNVTPNQDWLTEWTKQPDDSWTTGGARPRRVSGDEMVGAISERSLIVEGGAGRSTGDELYPGAPEFSEEDLRGAYDGLVDHSGFQVFYGIPAGNPLRDREVVSALNTEARRLHPDLSPKQAVLQHLRDRLGIENPAPAEAAEGERVQVGAADPKSTGVQGMNGGSFTVDDIQQAVDILEAFQGKAFKSELNKKGNALGVLDPSSIVGIHKDKTVAKGLFIEHLRNILAESARRDTERLREVLNDDYRIEVDQERSGWYVSVGGNRLVGLHSSRADAQAAGEREVETRKAMADRGFSIGDTVRLGSGAQDWKITQVRLDGVMLGAPEGERARNRWVPLEELPRLTKPSDPALGRVPTEMVGTSPESVEELESLPVGTRISAVGTVRVKTENGEWGMPEFPDDTKPSSAFADMLRAITINSLPSDEDQPEEAPEPEVLPGDRTDLFARGVGSRAQSAAELDDLPEGSIVLTDQSTPRQRRLAGDMGTGSYFQKTAGGQWSPVIDPTGQRTGDPDVSSEDLFEQSPRGVHVIAASGIARNREPQVGDLVTSVTELDSVPEGTEVESAKARYVKRGDAWHTTRAGEETQVSKEFLATRFLAGHHVVYTNIPTAGEEDHGEPMENAGSALRSARVGDTIISVNPDGTQHSWERVSESDYRRANGSLSEADNMPEELLARDEESDYGARWFVQRGGGSGGDGGLPEPETPEQPDRFSRGMTITAADLADLPSGKRIGYTRKRDGRVTAYSKRADGTFVTDRGTEVDITGWSNATFTVLDDPEGTPEAPEPPVVEPPADAPVGEEIGDPKDSEPGQVIEVTLDVNGTSEDLGYDGGAWQAGETRFLRRTPVGHWITSDVYGFEREYPGRYGSVSMTFTDDEVRWMQRNGTVTEAIPSEAMDPRILTEDRLVQMSIDGTLRGTVVETTVNGEPVALRNIADGSWMVSSNAPENSAGRVWQHGSVLKFAAQGDVRTTDIPWEPPAGAISTKDELDALRTDSVVLDVNENRRFRKRDDGQWVKVAYYGADSDEVVSAESLSSSMARWSVPGVWRVEYSAPESVTEDTRAGDVIPTSAIANLPEGSIVRDGGTYLIVGSGGTYRRFDSLGVSRFLVTTEPWVSRTSTVVRVGEGDIPGANAVPGVGETFDITDAEMMLSMPVGTRFTGPQYNSMHLFNGQGRTTYTVASPGVFIDEYHGEAVTVFQFSNIPLSAEAPQDPPVIEEPHPIDGADISTTDQLDALPIGAVLQKRGRGLPVTVVKASRGLYLVSGSNDALPMDGETVLWRVGRTERVEREAFSGETLADLSDTQPGDLVFDSEDLSKAWIRNADGTWHSNSTKDDPAPAESLRVIRSSGVPGVKKEALPAQILSARPGTRVRATVGSPRKVVTFEFKGHEWVEAGRSRSPQLFRSSRMAALAAAGDVQVWSVPEDGTKDLAGIDVQNDAEFWPAFQALDNEASIEEFAKRRMPKVEWVPYSTPPSLTKEQRADYVALYREYVGSALQFFEHYPELQDQIASVGGHAKKPRDNSWAWVQYNRGFADVRMRFHMTEGLSSHMSSHGRVNSNFHVSSDRNVSAPMSTVVHESGHVFDTMTQMALGGAAVRALNEYLQGVPAEERPLVRSQLGTYAHTNAKELVAEVFEQWHDFENPHPVINHIMDAIQTQFRSSMDLPDFEFRKFQHPVKPSPAATYTQQWETASDLLNANRDQEGDALSSPYANQSGTVIAVGNPDGGVDYYEQEGAAYYAIDPNTLTRRKGQYGVDESVRLDADKLSRSVVLRRGMGWSESSSKPFSTPDFTLGVRQRVMILNAAVQGSQITVNGVVYTKGADGFWYSPSGTRVSTVSLLDVVLRTSIHQEGKSYAKTAPASIDIIHLDFDVDYPSMAEAIRSHQDGAVQ